MQAGEVTAADATVHLFYELTPAELSGAVTRLRALKQRAGAATDASRWASIRCCSARG